MARNSSAIMSILWAFAPRQKSDPSKVNANFNDIAAELTNSLDRDGKGAMRATLRAISGSAAVPAVTFNSEKTTGLFGDDDQIGISIDGKTAFTIDVDGIVYADNAAQIDRLTPIGDYYDTARVMTNRWLLRNGAQYDVSAYPELAKLLVPTAPQLFWNPRTSGVTDTIRSAVDLGNGKIVAVGGDGTTPRIIRSLDNGETWATVTFAETRVLRSIARDTITGKLIAVGDGGLVATSVDDGANWSAETVAANNWASVCFIDYSQQEPGLTAFLIGGSAGGLMMKTTSDVSWQNRAQAGMTANITAVSTGRGGNLYKFATDDGRLFNSGFGTAAINVPGQNFRALMRGGAQVQDAGNWVLGNIASGKQSVLYVYDGKDYGFDADGQINASAFGYGGFTLAVGNGGAAYVTGSIGGKKWDERVSGTADHLYAVVWNEPDKRFVAFGANGKIVSADTISSEKFQVPADAPVTGWIKAK